MDVIVFIENINAVISNYVMWEVRTLEDRMMTMPASYYLLKIFINKDNGCCHKDRQDNSHKKTNGSVYDHLVKKKAISKNIKQQQRAINAASEMIVIIILLRFGETPVFGIPDLFNKPVIKFIDLFLRQIVYSIILMLQTFF